MDLLASFAAYFKQPVPKGEAMDSKNIWPALLGKTKTGRSVLVEQGGTLAVVKDSWKYITPGKGAAYNKLTGIELGNAPKPQLYNLSKDIGEKNNVAEQYPDKIKELSELLEKIKEENE